MTVGYPKTAQKLSPRLRCSLKAIARFDVDYREMWHTRRAARRVCHHRGAPGKGEGPLPLVLAHAEPGRTASQCWSDGVLRIQRREVAWTDLVLHRATQTGFGSHLCQGADRVPAWPCGDDHMAPILYRMWEVVPASEADRRYLVPREKPAIQWADAGRESVHGLPTAHEHRQRLPAGASALTLQARVDQRLAHG